MRSVLIKNTLYQILSRIATSISFVIVTILLTRSFGPEFYGKFSVVLTYSYVYFVLSEFGFNSYLVKEYAKSQEYAKKYFSKVVVFKAFYGVLLVILSQVVVMFMPYQNDVKMAIVIISPVILLQSLYMSATAIFQAYHKYIYQFIAVVSGAIFACLLSFWFTRLYPYDLNAQSISYLVSYLLILVLSFYLIREYIKVKSLAIDAKHIKVIFQESSAFGFSILVNFLMVNADRLIMTLYSPYQSISIYSVAYRMFDLVLIIPAYFMNSLYPELVKLKGDNPNEYNKKFNIAISYLIALSLVIILLTLIFGSFIIPKIFGTELSDASSALNILIISTPIFFITAPLGWKMVLENKQKELLAIHLAVLIFNIIACFIFIPIYDYKGAAIITGLSEFIILSGQYYFLYLKK